MWSAFLNEENKEKSLASDIAAIQPVNGKIIFTDDFFSYSITLVSCSIYPIVTYMNISTDPTLI